MTPTTRPAGEGDAGLLLAVYASSRAEELALVPWPEDGKAAFVRHQFEAQTRHYTSRYPGSEHLVLEVDGRPVGRIWIARQPDEIAILDVTLLPEERGHGLGERVVRDLVEEGRRRGLPVRIYVDQGSRSEPFFARLGFVVVAVEGVHNLWEAR